MVKEILSVLGLRFRTAYRNTDTGRFISKATYDRLPEKQRAKVKVRI